ncbi:MAG: hypothetical protein KGZ49_06075 [Syntrophaceae bacterium]|nr:hypothetical protein [Syntrophaceae bacterium]
MKSVQIYEEFMFEKYEEDRKRHDEWRFHYQQLQEVFELTLLRNQQTNIKIGLVGCGLCPCGRDLPTDFIPKYVISGKVSCMILFDISMSILKIAKENLRENGFPKNKADFRNIDITFGRAEAIGNMILNIISLNDKEAILGSLKEILPLRMQIKKQKCDVNLDFIYSPMTLLATLNPFITKTFEKLRNLKISSQFYETIKFEIERIWKQHNEKTIIELFHFFNVINRLQDWLIVTEVCENRFNGTRQERTFRPLSDLISEIADPLFLSVEEPWIWMDSDDHYHEVHAIHFRC